MMINTINNTAGTKYKTIKEWRVVFYVPPLGVFTELEKAVEAAQSLELNPLLVVVPMAAAITEDEMEVCFR